MGISDLPGVGLAVDASDFLVIESINSDTGVTLVVQVRLHLPSDIIQQSNFNIMPTPDRAVNRSAFKIGSGRVVSVSVTIATSGSIEGETFVSCYLSRDATSLNIRNFVFVSDYVFLGSGISWPGSLLRSSVEGPGKPSVLLFVSPAVGAELLGSVPSGSRLKILSFPFRFVTSAVAGNRRIHVDIVFSGNVLASVISSFVQGASITNDYIFSLGVPASVSNNSRTVEAFMDVILRQGFSVGTRTENIDAGDQFSAARLFALEWLELQ